VEGHVTILDLKPKGSAGAQAVPGAVIDVDERSFQQEVVERSRSTPVVIDFWAPWCGPCRTLGPTLEKLANEAKGAWVLAKVNVDNNPRLAQAFGVQGIPAVKAVFDGKLVDEFTGALPESQVRTWLKRFVPESAAKQAEDLAALEARDPRGAEQRYRQALAAEPANDDARLGLGRLLVQAGSPEGAELLAAIKLGAPQHAQAQAWLTLAGLMAETEGGDPFELLGRVDQSPGDWEARFQLAAHQIKGGRHADAIEQLLAIVAGNRAFREDGARKALLALFIALGDQSPLVPPGRKQLANLLF
jgi:putative thioredoxin